MSDSNIVITINRQLGGGATYIGHKLAERLNFLYVDREIVKEAAKDLQTFVEELETRDEKLGSVWRTVMLIGAFSNFEYTESVKTISDDEIYEVQSNFITEIGNHKSAVIIGRGSSYVLREHPRHVSIFIHAGLEFRKKQIQKLYNINEKEALHLIETTDKSRKKYLQKLTKQDMYDVRGYDLAIDTSKLGFKKAEDVIMEYLKIKFGDKLLKSQE